MTIFKTVKSSFRKLFSRKVTRGYGLLEFFLAVQRAKLANKLILAQCKTGRVLDIGCSSYPIFLLTANFVEKFGLDKIKFNNSHYLKRFSFIHYDIEEKADLSLEKDFFDVVTMLAFLEHIEYEKLNIFLKQVFSAVRPGGICIITVPSPWTHHLLCVLSKFSLISKVEIAEHKTNLRKRELLSLLSNAGFKNIKFGYFEFFMNRWIVCLK